jgi:Flp pilus assembly protein TadG
VILGGIIILRRFKSFVANTVGNVAMTFALCVLPFGLSAGVAIDYGRSYFARTVLQGAADAAALAGGTSKDKSDAAIAMVVKQYLDANGASDILQYVSKIDQQLDMSKGTLTVIVEGNIRTTFMGMAGFKSMDIGALSVVSVGSQALELALVLDNTGSMAGTKISNLKAAATTLVDIIQKEASDYADTKIAVVPFAEYVNVGVARGTEPWVDKAPLLSRAFSGCVGSRTSPRDVEVGSNGESYPALANEPCNVELLPLTKDLVSVKSRIAAMVSTGATYIPAGLMWGWNVLDASVPFTEGRTAADLKSINGRKVLVLMTDGENTISPTYPTHDGRDVAASNTTLADMCAKVKSDNIEMYTVSFMVPSVTVKNILVGCASAPTKYFDADNATELNAAFTQIARDLASIRFTQ